MGLELTENAKKWLSAKGWDPVMGARPLRRTIQRDIEDSLSERILFNELRPGHIIVVDCDGDPAKFEESKLTFRSVDKPGSIPDAVPADLTVPADASGPVDAPAPDAAAVDE
jgi:ATP-dependent Clp protease ATP-binding subunit ClpC